MTHLNNTSPRNQNQNQNDPSNHSVGSVESKSFHSSSSRHSSGNRSSPPLDFCVIAEFCERQGPMILHTTSSSPYDDISSRINLKQLALRLMTVDYQTPTPRYLDDPKHLYISFQKQSKFPTLFSAVSPPIPKETDSILQFRHSNRTWFAYVRHFTSYDLQARGRVRPMCVAYLTLNVDKLSRNFDIIRCNLSIVTFFLRCGNLITFLSDARRRLLDLAYTQKIINDCLELKEKVSKTLNKHCKNHQNPTFKNNNDPEYQSFNYVYLQTKKRLLRSLSTARKQYESLQLMALGLRRSLLSAVSKVGLKLYLDNTHSPMFYLGFATFSQNTRSHRQKGNLVRIFDNVIPDDNLEFSFSGLSSNSKSRKQQEDIPFSPSSEKSFSRPPRVIDVLATYQSNRNHTRDSFHNLSAADSTNTGTSIDSYLIPSHGNLRPFLELFGDFDSFGYDFEQSFDSWSFFDRDAKYTHRNSKRYTNPNGGNITLNKSPSIHHLEPGQSIFDFYFSFHISSLPEKTDINLPRTNANIYSFYFHDFLDILPDGYHNPFNFYFAEYTETFSSSLSGDEIFQYYFQDHIDVLDLEYKQNNLFSFYFEQYTSQMSPLSETESINPFNYYFDSYLSALHDSQSTLLHDSINTTPTYGREPSSSSASSSFNPLRFALKHLGEFLNHFSQSLSSFASNRASVRDAQQYESWLSIGNMVLPTNRKKTKVVFKQKQTPRRRRRRFNKNKNNTNTKPKTFIPSLEKYDGHLPDLFHVFGLHIVASPLENMTPGVQSMLESFPISSDSPLNHNPSQFSHLMKENSVLSLDPSYSHRFNSYFFKLFPWRTQSPKSLANETFAPIQILPPHYFHQIALPTRLFWLANFMPRLYRPTPPIATLNNVPQFPPFGFLLPNLSSLAPHIVYSLLTCRPVVVLGSEDLVRQIIAALSFFVPLPNPHRENGASSNSDGFGDSESENQNHFYIQPWITKNFSTQNYFRNSHSKANSRSSTLTAESGSTGGLQSEPIGLSWSDISSLLLFGCPRTLFANSPLGLQYSCSILDVDTKVYYGPPYIDGKILWSWFGLNPNDPSQFINSTLNSRNRRKSIDSYASSISSRSGHSGQSDHSRQHSQKHPNPNGPYGPLFVPTKVDPKWVSSASRLSETRSRFMSSIHKISIAIPPPSAPWFGWHENSLSLSVPRLNPDDTTFTLFFQYELKKLFSLVQRYSCFYASQQFESGDILNNSEFSHIEGQIGGSPSPRNIVSIMHSPFDEGNIEKTPGEHKIVTIPLDSKSKSPYAVFGVSLDKQFENSKSRIPPIILEAIRYLQPFLTRSEGLFRVPGTASDIAQLKRQIDSGPYSHIFTGHSPHTVSSLLKTYLMQLPEPLFLWSNYDRLIDLGSRNVVAFRPDTETKENPIHRSLRILIARLPLANRLTLGTIFRFLNQVCNHSHYNKMTASNLSMVFGPSLIRSEIHVSPETFLYHSSAMKNIISILISHVDHFFPIDQSSSPVRSSDVAVNGDDKRLPPSTVIDYDTSLTTEWDDDIVDDYENKTLAEEILSKYGSSDIEIFHSLSQTIFAKSSHNKRDLTLVDCRPCIHLSASWGDDEGDKVGLFGLKKFPKIFQ